jgi:hypothetical protein
MPTHAETWRANPHGVFDVQGTSRRRVAQIRPSFINFKSAMVLAKSTTKAAIKILGSIIDAPMSRSARRFGQIGQDERVQFPDDVALQTTMN